MCDPEGCTGCEARRHVDKETRRQGVDDSRSPPSPCLPVSLSPCLYSSPASRRLRLPLPTVLLRTGVGWVVAELGLRHPLGVGVVEQDVRAAGVAVGDDVRLIRRLVTFAVIRVEVA